MHRLKLAAILALALSQCARSAPPPPCAVRFTIPPPPDAQFSPQQIPAVSPDGSHLAFTAVGPDRIARLWVHSLSRSVVRLLPGTSDASFPFWSPDGDNLGFFADGQLKRVDLLSSTPKVLADALEGRGASWSAEGIIVFSAASGQSSAHAIFSIPSTGGAVRRLTNLATDHQAGDFWPAFLPDNEHFVYSSFDEQKRLMFLGSIRSREKIYLLDGSSPMSAGPGFLLYADDHALLRVRFRNKVLAASRARDLVVHAVARGSFGIASFSSSADGTVVVYGRAGREIVWLNAEGQEVPAIPDPGSYWQPSLSPSGEEILVSVGGPSGIYYVYAPKSDRWRRVTAGMGSAHRPLWAADGTEIIFTAIDSMRTQVRAARADGSGVVRNLFDESKGAYAAAVSPQGNLLAIVEPPTATRATVNLRVVSLTGPVSLDASTVWQRDTAWKQYAPAFSPDGLRLAYVSEQSGRAEVYVSDLVPGSVPLRVSRQGGTDPLWSGDGRLIYTNAAGIVAVTTDGSPSTWGGREHVVLGDEALREKRYSMDDFDVTRDGTRFLMLKSPDPDKPAPLMGLAACGGAIPRMFP